MNFNKLLTFISLLSFTLNAQMNKIELFFPIVGCFCFWKGLGIMAGHHYGSIEETEKEEPLELKEELNNTEDK